MRKQSRFFPSVLPWPLKHCFVPPLYDPVLVVGLIFLDALFDDLGHAKSKIFPAAPTMLAKLSESPYIRLSRVGMSAVFVCILASRVYSYS